MRLRWFLGLSTVMLLVVGLTVVVHDRLDGSSSASDQVIAPAEGDGGDGTGDLGEQAGAVPVRGTVRALHLEGAIGDPRLVATPLTVVSERGFGNGGEVTGVEVGGQPSAIVWDGGRPFVLASGPGLVPEPATVDLTAEGVRVSLGGGAHRLEPGAYRLDTPVAVGQAGVATAYDAVSFAAGPAAQLEASGDAALVLGPDGPHRFVGPGSVRLEGDLHVGEPDGAQPATAVELAEGPFELTFTPDGAGGWTVTGLLQPRPGRPLSLA